MPNIVTYSVHANQHLLMLDVYVVKYTTIHVYSHDQNNPGCMVTQLT